LIGHLDFSQKPAIDPGRAITNMRIRIVNNDGVANTSLP
jgi:hypothetical protein